MDIQGLVNHNHNSSDERGFSPLSPPDHSGDSARSQLPPDSVMPQPSLYHPLPLRNRDEIYPPHYQLPNSTDQTTSPHIKRHLTDGLSPTLYGGGPPAKRRIGEAINGEDGKTFRTRRRALQACESCRAKKSKCDNGRPSCGSCLQHGLHCVYKGAPSLTAYATLPD